MVVFEQLRCFGCGKRLKDFSKYEAHAKQCKKFKRLMQPSCLIPTYSIPIVSMEDLVYLEVRRLCDNEWAIWNIKRNEWVKDTTGQVDSRLFNRNIRLLLKRVIAVSINSSINKLG